MTITDPDVIALCAAIRANPDDDTVRLGLADAIDEIGGVSVPCPKCKGKGEIRGDGMFSSGKPCLDCGGKVLGPHSHRKGTGFVPGRSFAARAELIRVQVELVKFDHAHDPLSEDGYDDPDGPDCAICDRLAELRDRGSAILTEFADGWRKGPVCTAVGPHHRDVCSGGRHEAANAQFTVECEACHGSGDAGGLMQRDHKPPHDETSWNYSVTYHRGMTRVTVPTLADVVKETACPNCKGNIRLGVGNCIVCKNGPHGSATGKVIAPSDWLAAVAKAHPDVVEVWCEDRVPWEPGQLRPRSNNFTWLRRPNAGEQHAYSEMANSALPEPLHRLVVKLNRGRNGWDGSDAARLALARAVARWMHGEGGS